ncbi:MAG TPA: tetratricopeptide repeat protein [Geopsychrobacteraceae bacterium]|nr:tetratricopeptide repeat protein [Geopsychrobacteraceae bacterium]
MSLRKLKKELRKKGPGAQKNRRRATRLLLLAVLGFLLTVALVFGYRNYQQTAPERLFTKGLTLESKDRPERALTSYERLFSSYPGAPKAPEALFRAARLKRLDLRQDQQALYLFLKLEHDYPESDFVFRAQREAAELTKYRLRDFAQAIVIYQRLLDQETDDGDRILYEIADCYFRLNNFSQARIELDALLERFPESSLRAEVLYRYANALLLDDMRGEARDGFNRLIESFPKSSYALEAGFSLAEMLETEEKLKDALKAYRALKDYPQQELLQGKISRLEQRIAKKKKVL